MALDFDHAQKQSPSTLLVIDDLLPARCFRFRETVCAWQGDKTRKFETETRVTILVTVCGPDNPGNENARSGNASYLYTRSQERLSGQLNQHFLSQWCLVGRTGRGRAFPGTLLGTRTNFNMEILLKM